MSARNWCFTLNNYTIEEYCAIEDIPCRYCIIGIEKSKTGTPHLQGYIEMNKVYRFSGMKKLIPRAHLEQRKGSREKARDYCKKENEWIEFGNWELGGQGRRTDIDLIRNLAQNDGMRAVAAIGTFQQIRVAEKYLTYNEEPRDWKPRVVYIHGPAGAGKSHKAREITGTEDLYTKNDDTIWWEGYDGHENVIIDDFRSSWWKLTEMLSLLDRYEKRVQFKGGYRQFKPKLIIITSVFPPNELYNNVTSHTESIAQLLRRIDEIIDMKNYTKGVEIINSIPINDCYVDLGLCNEDFVTKSGGNTNAPDPPKKDINNIDKTDNILWEDCHDDLFTDYMKKIHSYNGKILKDLDNIVTNDYSDNEWNDCEDWGNNEITI